MFLTLPTQQEHNPGQNPAGEEEGEGQTRGEQKQVRVESCSFYSWYKMVKHDWDLKNTTTYCLSLPFFYMSGFNRWWSDQVLFLFFLFIKSFQHCRTYCLVSVDAEVALVFLEAQRSTRICISFIVF